MMSETGTKVTGLRFFPGETVKIITPDIVGRVVKIEIFGNWSVEYTVRWWIDGKTLTDRFVESELEQTAPHEEIKVGFGK